MQWQQQSIARQIFQEASRGERVVLPKAGTALENPYVFDSVAREIKELATGFGDLEVLDERHDSADAELITAFSFCRR